MGFTVSEQVPSWAHIGGAFCMAFGHHASMCGRMVAINLKKLAGLEGKGRTVRDLVRTYIDRYNLAPSQQAVTVHQVDGEWVISERQWCLKTHQRPGRDRRQAKQLPFCVQAGPAVDPGLRLLRVAGHRREEAPLLHPSYRWWPLVLCGAG